MRPQRDLAQRPLEAVLHGGDRTHRPPLSDGAGCRSRWPWSPSWACACGSGGATSSIPPDVTLPWAPSALPDGPRPLTRTTDGTGQRPYASGHGVGRGALRSQCATGRDCPSKVLEPNPRRVSLELLTRERFQPATTLNVLAAAWLQFEVHDWFSHGPTSLTTPWLVDLDPNDPWPQHPMQIQRTHRAAPTTDGKPPTYRNTETHWWDASQVYGSTPGVPASDPRPTRAARCC